jgi:hypothetical protein
VPRRSHAFTLIVDLIIYIDKDMVMLPIWEMYSAGLLHLHIDDGCFNPVRVGIMFYGNEIIPVYVCFKVMPRRTFATTYRVRGMW